jgi:hypothetical protein
MGDPLDHLPRRVRLGLQIGVAIASIIAPSAVIWLAAAMMPR